MDRLEFVFPIHVPESILRFDRLDLNLLVALDALIEHRNVSAAAKQIFLSQPAVSGALGRLREYFGDELLVSVGRQMLLTPKAEELRLPVREALMLIRSRITTPSTFEPSTAEREFTIVASDYAYSVFTSKVIRTAADSAPNVKFEISSTSIATRDKFERGEFDLLMTVDAYLSDEHPRLELFEDEQAVISWSGGPYAKDLTSERYLAADHVIPIFGADRHPAITETFFNQLGLERRIQVRVPSFSAVPEAIVGTARLGTMWRRQAEIFAGYLPITLHRPPVPMPRVIEEVQWHRFREADEGLRWLLALIRSEASKMPPLETK